MNYIHPTALIGPNVTLGDNNYIGPYCIIGFPAEHKKFRDGYPTGHVVIGDNNHFEGLVTIDAGTIRATVICSGVWFLKHSHAGHDCLIHDGVTVSCGAKIGGETIVGERTNIGLNAVIHQRLTIPERCMIGMGAVVTKKSDLVMGMKYVGNPVKCIGFNV